jgi:hypothetical protein
LAGLWEQTGEAKRSKEGEPEKSSSRGAKEAEFGNFMMRVAQFAVWRMLRQQRGAGSDIVLLITSVLAPVIIAVRRVLVECIVSLVVRKRAWFWRLVSCASIGAQSGRYASGAIGACGCPQCTGSVPAVKLRGRWVSDVIAGMGITSSTWRSWRGEGADRGALVRALVGVQCASLKTKNKVKYITYYYNYIVVKIKATIKHRTMGNHFLTGIAR